LTEFEIIQCKKLSIKTELSWYRIENKKQIKMKKTLLALPLLTAMIMCSCSKDPVQNISNANSASNTNVSNATRGGGGSGGIVLGLGASAPYTALGLTGTQVNLSNVTINGGSVGVGSLGSLIFGSPSTVNGNMYINTGATYSINGHLNGTLYTQQDLSAAEAGARSAAALAAAMTPTATYATWTTAQTIQGNGDWNVINVGSVNIGSSNNITLNGTINDYFVINVTGSFAMSGSAKIITSGTVPSSHVILNIVGTGTTATANINNMITGTILAVNRSVIFHGVAGQVICGGSSLYLMSGATVNYIPFTYNGV
jgi:hypothetical protein